MTVTYRIKEDLNKIYIQNFLRRLFMNLLGSHLVYGSIASWRPKFLSAAPGTRRNRRYLGAVAIGLAALVRGLLYLTRATHCRSFSAAARDLPTLFFNFGIVYVRLTLMFLLIREPWGWFMVLPRASADFFLGPLLPLLLTGLRATTYMSCFKHEESNNIIKEQQKK